MRTEDIFRIAIYEEGVLHVSCRVIVRKIKGGEIVPVVLNLRSFCYGKADLLKNADDAIEYYGKWMPSARYKRITGQGKVMRLIGRLILCIKYLLEFFQTSLCAILEFVQGFSQFPLLLTGKATELIKHLIDDALFDGVLMAVLLKVLSFLYYKGIYLCQYLLNFILHLNFLTRASYRKVF